MNTFAKCYLAICIWQFAPFLLLTPEGQQQFKKQNNQVLYKMGITAVYNKL